jgi:hypothetical protein
VESLEDDIPSALSAFSVDRRQCKKKYASALEDTLRQKTMSREYKPLLKIYLKVRPAGKKKGNTSHSPENQCDFPAANLTLKVILKVVNIL